MSEQPETVQIGLIWPGVDALPVLRANQFLGQLAQGPQGEAEDFVLTVGYVGPPVILGTPEEQQAAARALGAVAVNPLSRVAMSEGRLRELVNFLAGHLAEMERLNGTKR